MQPCMGGFFMNGTKLILKLAALILALGAVICLVIAHYDRITDALARLLAKVQAKKQAMCGCCSCGEFSDEFDDYEEWGM